MKKKDDFKKKKRLRNKIIGDFFFFHFIIVFLYFCLFVFFDPSTALCKRKTKQLLSLFDHVCSVTYFTSFSRL